MDVLVKYDIGISSFMLVLLLNSKTRNIVKYAMEFLGEGEETGKGERESEREREKGRACVKERRQKYM